MIKVNIRCHWKCTMCRRFDSVKFGVKENLCFCLFPVILHTLLFKWFPVNILYTLECFKPLRKNLVISATAWRCLAADRVSHIPRQSLLVMSREDLFHSDLLIFEPTDGWRSAGCTAEGDEQLSRRQKPAKVQHLHSAMFPLCGGEPHAASLWDSFSPLTDCHPRTPPIQKGLKGIHPIT